MSEPATGSRGLSEDRGAGRGWWSVLLTLGLAVLLLGGIYVGTAFYFKDRPPTGLTVAGVEVGSLTHDDAVATLDARLQDLTADPVQVRVQAEGADAEVMELVPQEAGLGLDLEGTLDGVTGLSLDPRVLWSHVAGTDRDLPLRTTVDRDALGSAVAALAAGYDRAPEDGEISIGAEGVEVVDAVEGRAMDAEATTGAIEQAWSRDGLAQATGEERAVEGDAQRLAPALTQAEIDRFTQEELEPALGAPVRVEASRGEGESQMSATAELTERDLRPLLEVGGSDGRLALELDEDGMLSRLRQDLGQLEAGPRDATVRLEGGSVEVVPSAVGYALTEQGLVEQVRTALGAQGQERTVQAQVEEVQPEIPTEASEGWSFSPMGSFVSVFPTGPSNDARTANLRAGVGHVNGTVVMPGEQFSLGAALGEISPQGGYVEAPVIIDGRLVMGLGGGLSQISTVVLNASWNAGVQLDSHTPHSFYISRYPAGREATLAYPVIDNLWTNDTDTPVVVQSWVQGDAIHMVLLGERQYDVTTVDGNRHSYTQGETVVDDSPSCVTQGRAEGFTITVARILSQNGTQVHRDEFTTTYKPADEVTCTHPDADRR